VPVAPNWGLMDVLAGRKSVKRIGPVLLLVIAGALLAGGCAKSGGSSEKTSAQATAAGPISDLGSTGLKGEKREAKGADAVHGKAVYTQNCAQCHGAIGTEGGVGPSLRNERSRKDMAKAIEWIKNPQPPMPKLFPSTLKEQDVADVAAYVESL